MTGITFKRRRVLSGGRPRDANHPGASVAKELARGEAPSRLPPVSEFARIARAPYSVHRARLGNGLRVCTVRTPHLHSATVALYVRTGSRYETDRDNGLSHFLEHMLFRGSSRYPDSLSLNLAIEDLGGTLYAETGRDHALYQVSLGRRGVQDAIAILGDLFTRPAFTALEAERRLVLEEILEDFDDRGRMVNLHDLVRATAFAGHPLAYPIVGPAHNVRRFTLADVRRHFRRFYNASNMILCVGGPVDPKAVAGWARQHFSGIRAGSPVQPRRVQPDLSGPQCKCVATESAQSQVQMAFHAPAVHDPDHPALLALLRLLDDGMATPLHYRVADQKGLAYSIAAENESFFDTSLLEIDAACSPGKLGNLVDEVLDILRGFVDRPPSAESLARSKRRYREDLESSYDDVGALCAWFGGSELFVRPTTLEQRMRRMAAVTASQVQAMARRVFTKQCLVSVIMGHYEAAEVRRVRRAFKSL